MNNVYLTAYIEDWDLFNSKMTPKNESSIYTEPGEFIDSQAFIRPMARIEEPDRKRTVLFYFRCRDWLFKSQFEINDKASIQPQTFYARHTPLYDSEVDDLARRLSIRLKCTVLCRYDEPNGCVSAKVYNNGEIEENTGLFIEDFQSKFDKEYMSRQRDNMFKYYETYFSDWRFSVINEECWQKIRDFV